MGVEVRREKMQRRGEGWGSTTGTAGQEVEDPLETAGRTQAHQHLALSPTKLALDFRPLDGKIMNSFIATPNDTKISVSKQCIFAKD